MRRRNELVVSIKENPKKGRGKGANLFGINHSLSLSLFICHSITCGNRRSTKVYGLGFRFRKLPPECPPKQFTESVISTVPLLLRLARISVDFSGDLNSWFDLGIAFPAREMNLRENGIWNEISRQNGKKREILAQSMVRGLQVLKDWNFRQFSLLVRDICSLSSKAIKDMSENSSSCMFICKFTYKRRPQMGFREVLEHLSVNKNTHFIGSKKNEYYLCSESERDYCWKCQLCAQSCHVYPAYIIWIDPPIRNRTEMCKNIFLV